MTLESQRKANKKWYEKKKEDGWKKFTCFVPAHIHERLCDLLNKLRSEK